MDLLPWPVYSLIPLVKAICLISVSKLLIVSTKIHIFFVKVKLNDLQTKELCSGCNIPPSFWAEVLLEVPGSCVAGVVALQMLMQWVLIDGTTAPFPTPL